MADQNHGSEEVAEWNAAVPWPKMLTVDEWESAHVNHGWWTHAESRDERTGVVVTMQHCPCGASCVLPHGLREYDPGELIDSLPSSTEELDGRAWLPERIVVVGRRMLSLWRGKP